MRNAPSADETYSVAAGGSAEPGRSARHARRIVQHRVEYRDLDRSSDDELFARLRTADAAERERIQELLVRRYAGLVGWLVAKYANPAVDVEELAQVGYLGLLLAIRRFDPDRGCQFVSYARPTVQGEIRRWFRDKRRWVRLPRQLQEAKARLRTSTEVLSQRLGREPVPTELAEHCGLPPATVRKALATDDTYTVASLDAGLGPDDDPDASTVAETLGEEDHRIELFLDCAALRPLVAQLPEPERRVLYLRFYQEKNQYEIAAELGCSQMHVSRLLHRTLEQLRAQLVV
jgi:RNA polymerase sigma-B factor